MSKPYLILIIICTLGLSLRVLGSYPPEWNEYTSGGYLFDIQTDSNSTNQSETFFKNSLLDIARANLAKQIDLKIQDHAQLNTTAIDGRSHVQYNSETKFKTSANLRFIETKTFYNHINKEGSAIAYISIARTCNFYANKLLLLNNKIENAIKVAENYIAEGLRVQAKSELEAALSYFPSTEEPLGWMNIFGTSQSELNQWQSRINGNAQKIKQLLAEQQYGTRIYLKCEADLFGESYPLLEKELKGLLSTIGCNFTNDESSADWAISIYCSARESNHVIMGDMHAYFSYVDAVITLDRGKNSQRVMEDAISEKGGDTRNYHAAAKAAYRKIKEILAEHLKQNIQ